MSRPSAVPQLLLLIKPILNETKLFCVAESLVGGLPAGAEAAVWSFSSQTRVEQTFTSDRQLLLEKIDAASHMQGSTNLAEAFLQAQQVFAGREKSSAIILITDGVPDNLDEAIAAKPRVHLVPSTKTLAVVLCNLVCR